MLAFPRIEILIHLIGTVIVEATLEERLKGVLFPDQILGMRLIQVRHSMLTTFRSRAGALDMSKSLSSVLLILLIQSACASKTETPLRVQSEAEAKNLFSLNPSEAVSLLAKDEAIASSAYKGIESGDSKWLDLYKKVRPASDASVSESLDQSVGLAIIHNPTAAIDAIVEVSKGDVGQKTLLQYLNWPCGATSADFSEPEGNKQKERAAKDTASKELKAKIKALKSIKSSNMKTANDCREIAQQVLKRWTSK